MAEEFRHNAEECRFEAWIDGEFVGEAAYTVRDGVARFDHTFVQPARRNTGIAGRLVRYAFEQVRAAGEWKVKPVCPYVVQWMRQNPDFDDLLV